MNTFIPGSTLRARMADIQARGTQLAITLAPTLTRMPYPMQRYDDSFFPYSRAVIDATADLSAAYVFDLAAYLSVGASGAIALERSIAYVPNMCLTILHGPFSQPGYAGLLSELGFHAECATLQPVNAADIAVLAEAFLSAALGVFLIGDEYGASFYPDRIGSVMSDQPDDALAPDRWLHLSGIPAIDWGWYGDSVALASRGEDFQSAVQSAALLRRDWLNEKASHTLSGLHRRPQP